jgi:hypothetical protein
MSSMIQNLKLIDVSMFIPISPNINWQNNSNWSRTHQIFRPHFNQVHLSAVSSAVGLDPLYLNKYLIGGSAILTFGLWASKVSQTIQDESGYGSFTVTTMSGKNKKCISFISAYIAIQKGSDIGTEFLFAQQLTIYEKLSLKSKRIPSKKFSPRENAIKL